MIIVKEFRLPFDLAIEFVITSIGLTEVGIGFELYFNKNARECGIHIMIATIQIDTMIYKTNRKIERKV